MHDGLEKFELKEQLGRGAFSVVRRAIRRDTNEEVAIKIIDRVKAGDTEQKRLQTEIAILQKVKHPVRA
jgi:serine/threonine protein kinase